jgi:hypothetical protein
VIKAQTSDPKEGKVQTVTRIPKLCWSKVGDIYEAEAADGTHWELLRHATPPHLQGKSPNWRPAWWLHSGMSDEGSLVGLVTSGRWTALHRHPATLRYADVLAAGWTNRAYIVQGGTPTDETGQRNFMMARLDPDGAVIEEVPLFDLLTDTEQ